MKTNKLTQAVLAGSIALAGSSVAMADDHGKMFELSGNVALTSDYRFRGITQTDGGPAIQGGFDAELASGVYIGTWASNVEWKDGASMEIDYYVGYAGEISDAVSYDVGYIYYDYPQNNQGGPGNSEADFDEWYASFSAAGATLGYAHSADFYGGAGTAEYVYADYSMDVGQGVALDLHIGNQSVNSDNYFGASVEDYTDWSIGVSKDMYGVNLGLNWVDTDIDETRLGKTGLEKNGSDTLVFTISKSL